MQRIIAVDYGDARTGVAVSDLTGTMAGDALTIEEWDAQRLAQRLAFFARERQAGLFVLGLPKNMDGTRAPGRKGPPVCPAAGGGLRSAGRALG